MARRGHHGKDKQKTWPPSLCRRCNFIVSFFYSKAPVTTVVPSRVLCHSSELSTLQGVKHKPARLFFSTDSSFVCFHCKALTCLFLQLVVVLKDYIISSIDVPFHVFCFLKRAFLTLKSYRYSSLFSSFLQCHFPHLTDCIWNLFFSCTIR